MRKILEAKDIFVEQLGTDSKIVNFFDNKGIAKQFADFMEKFQIDNERYYKAHYENLECPKLRCSVGRNYIKINDGRSVVAFIDKYGNIYKPASWQAPATGVRYYVSDWRSINTDPHGSWLYGNTNLVPKGPSEVSENVSEEIGENSTMRKVIEAVVDEAALQYEKKYKVGKGEYKGAIVFVQKSKSSKSVQIIAQDERLDIWEPFDNEKEAQEWLDDNGCKEIKESKVIEAVVSEDAVIVKGDLLSKLSWDLKSAFSDDEFIGVVEIENGASKEITKITFSCAESNSEFKGMLQLQDFTSVNRAGINKPSDGEEFWSSKDVNKIATLFKNFKKNKILKDSVRNATIK